jgi:hypothetical protein
MEVGLMDSFSLGLPTTVLLLKDDMDLITDSTILREIHLNNFRVMQLAADFKVLVRAEERIAEVNLVELTGITALKRLIASMKRRYAVLNNNFNFEILGHPLDSQKKVLAFTYTPTGVN